MAQFTKKDRVLFKFQNGSSLDSPLGTVTRVVGELVAVQWDSKTYPYRDHNHSYDVNEDCYLERQLILASGNEKQ